MTRLIPKLKSGKNLSLSLEARLDLSSQDRENLEKELKRVLEELNLNGWVIERKKKP